MSTLRVSNIEAKADPSSPSVDEKLKVTNSNGDVLIHIDGKTAGITTVGINTTDSSFTVDAAQNIEFIGIVTATKFSLSGGGEITGGDGNFTGIVTAGSLSVTNNVSIGGTLTYEDVTSIDSVGIITAQSDVHVGAGLSVVGISTLANTNVNGQLTASNFNVTGVSTLGNTVIGTGTTELIVTGDARVTGILTATTFSGNLTGNVTGNVTGESTLSGISSSISDTAVDVFVYDTSKDSDGGAWRKRTQHTSWYNETLNTATRGSRKEFPSVAVIVAEATKVTIYDGDDPDLPMWMVLNADSSDPTKYAIVRSVGKTISSLYALNGIICDPVSYNGLFYQNFVEDACYRVNTANTIFGGSIVNRNGGMNFALNVTSSGLVHSTVNDVAMTVLPNAPVDSATGLPVPTIAVATDGGTSVIGDDGTVADLSGFSPVTTVHIDENNVIGTSNSGTPTHDFIFKTHIPPSDEAYSAGITAGSYNYYMNSNNTTTPLLRDIDMTSSAYNSKDDITYRGGTGGVDYINAAEAISNISTTSAIAYISKDYNTGYMHGDIKGAFLSDTDTTDKTNGQTDPDRSVENNTVTVVGTVTKSVVATGADLVAYSGFTASNYMYYNSSDMAFGTGDFSVSVWCIPSTDETNEFILELDNASSGSNRFYILTTATATKKLYTPWNNNIAGSELIPAAWNHVVVGRTSGVGYVYVNGNNIPAGTVAWNNALNGNGNGTISNYSAGIANNYAWSGSLALLRISGSAPSAEQIKKMYEDERVLFQENAKATLYGSSDAVTALAFDEVTDQLHVGTSAGRSDFQGLRRINNTTTAVTTAISAHDEFIIEQ